jgi:Leucine-rich repeat (LRR) protein
MSLNKTDFHHHSNSLQHSNSISYLTSQKQVFNGSSLSNAYNNITITNANSIANSLLNSQDNIELNNHLSTTKQQQLQQQQQQQQIQWIELEIKGFVKNISPKLWQWTHLKYLYLNDNNLMRLPPVISNLAQLQYLDASNNKIRTLPAEIGIYYTMIFCLVYVLEVHFATSIKFKLILIVLFFFFSLFVNHGWFR